MRRAIFDITVAGTNISTALRPVLIDLSITDNKGTHSDTATITVDDTGGQIMLPKHGAPVKISIGWVGEGIREVFAGTVDVIGSSGSKSGGRTLSIGAKGVNTLGKAKEGQSRHFDDQTVEDVLKQAGEYAGVTGVEVDPQLAKIKLPYIDMREESFIHLGERLAALVGGSFRVQGDKAVMARRGAEYKPSVTAQFGVNLISWNMSPIIGRGRYKKARAKSYDMAKAEEVVVEEETGLDDEGAEATVTRRDLMADKDEAGLAAKGDAATSAESAGAGSIEIDGSTDAVPGGQCVLTGARPGVDGIYTIQSVTHSLSKSGGWVTGLQLGNPKGGAGKDKRGGKKGGSGNSSGAGDAALDAMLNEGTP